MRYKYFDAALFQLMLMMAVLSGYQFFYVQYSQNLTTNFESLAFISNQDKIVKRKNFDSFAWTNAIKGQGLAQDDLVFTDENSSADIAFIKGPQISISENTLFKVTKFKERTEVKIEDGLVHLKLDEQNPSANFLLGNKNIKLTSQSRSADIQILTQNSVSKISILNGEVSAQMDGESSNIGEGEFVQVSSEENKFNVEKNQLKTLFPKSGSMFHFVQSQFIRFEWSKNKVVLFELAKDRDFKEVVVSTKTASPYTVDALDEGHYYWRVKIGESVSQLSSFKLIELRPVTLIAPQNRSMLSFAKSNESKVLFKWDESKGSAYEIEISSKKEKIRERVESNHYIHKNLAPGMYRWRVNTTHSQSKTSLWSEYSMFEIESPRLLKAVELDGPDNDIKFNFYDELEIKSTPLTYSWKKLAKAKSYRWRMEDSQGKIVDSFETSDTQIERNLIKEGNFKWMVQAIDYFSKLGEKSETRSITVKILKANYDEKTGSVKIVLKKPNQQVKFEWVETGSKNLFEVSSDPEFKKIIHKEKTSDSHANFSFPKLGTYYWRTKKITNTGEVIYSKPKKVKIEPTPPPEKLEEVPDLELEIKTQKTTSILNWLINSAYADYDYVKLKWPVVEEMKGYVVEIYDNSKKKLVLKRKVKDNFMQWHNPPPGEYYYRVAQIDFWDRVSEFSELAHINVKPKHAVEGKTVKVLAPKPVQVVRPKRILKEKERVHPQYLRFYDFMEISYEPTTFTLDIDDEDFNSKITGSMFGTFNLKGRHLYKKSRFYDYNFSWQRGSVFNGNNSWLNSEARFYMARPYAWKENKFVGKYGILAKYISTYKMKTNEILDDETEVLFSFATQAEFEFGSRKRLGHHLSVGAAIGQVNQVTLDYELRMYHFKNFIIHLNAGSSFSIYQTKTASNTLVDQKIGLGISFYFPPKLSEFISADFWTSSPNKVKVKPHQGIRSGGR